MKEKTPIIYVIYGRAKYLGQLDIKTEFDVIHGSTIDWIESAKKLIEHVLATKQDFKIICNCPDFWSFLFYVSEYKEFSVIFRQYISKDSFLDHFNLDSPFKFANISFDMLRHYILDKK